MQRQKGLGRVAAAPPPRPPTTPCGPAWPTIPYPLPPPPPFQAVRIDEAVPGAATSSMVDDAFFVLLKAGRRCMGTGKAPSVVAILNQVDGLLCTLYRNALAAALQGAAGRLAAAAPPEPGEAPGPGAAAAATAFNNAEVSAAYVGKLRGQLEDLAGQCFYAANDRDRIKMVRWDAVQGAAAGGTSGSMHLPQCGAGRRASHGTRTTAPRAAQPPSLLSPCSPLPLPCHLAQVLADLGKTAGDLRQLATKGLDGLCAGLMPRLRPALDEAAAAPYELAESDLAGPAGGASAWPQQLLVGLQAHLSWLQPLLTPTNYDALVHLVLDKVGGLHDWWWMRGGDARV